MDKCLQGCHGCQDAGANSTDCLRFCINNQMYVNPKVPSLYTAATAGVPAKSPKSMPSKLNGRSKTAMFAGSAMSVSVPWSVTVSPVAISIKLRRLRPKALKLRPPDPMENEEVVPATANERAPSTSPIETSLRSRHESL